MKVIKTFNQMYPRISALIMLTLISTGFMLTYVMLSKSNLFTFNSLVCLLVISCTSLIAELIFIRVKAAAIYSEFSKDNENLILPEDIYSALIAAGNKAIVKKGVIDSVLLVAALPISVLILAISAVVQVVDGDSDYIINSSFIAYYVPDKLMSTPLYGYITTLEKHFSCKVKYCYYFKIIRENNVNEKSILSAVEVS